MERPLSSYLAPAVALFATLAVLCAGIGGLLGEGPHRTLLAAGSAFWLAMLFVAWIFVSTRVPSRLSQSGISAAIGALTGLCCGLCFTPERGWIGLVSATAIGAICGFVGYWLSLLRYDSRNPKRLG